MRIIKRLKNAYSSGGFKEVVRKSYYYILYYFQKKKIIFNISNCNPEYAISYQNSRDYKVIVALTTYPKRFNSMELCLRSLTVQTVKPNKIIVYLGSDAIGAKIPPKIEKYKSFGIEFVIDDKFNLKSHKKYYYAIKQFPNDVIVTADDDTIYPKNWLESLLDSYEKYPNAISARRVHQIKKNKKGELLPYNKWKDQCRDVIEPSFSLIATGNSGVLYPPNSLDSRVLDFSQFMDICSEADDIWLKCMSVLKGTKVVWVPNNCIDLPETNNSDSMLSSKNVWENKNDYFLKKVMEKYNISAKDFFD